MEYVILDLFDPSIMAAGGKKIFFRNLKNPWIYTWVSNKIIGHNIAK